jgi:hypothetical protein
MEQSRRVEELDAVLANEQLIRHVLLVVGRARAPVMLTEVARACGVDRDAVRDAVALSGALEVRSVSGADHVAIADWPAV